MGLGLETNLRGGSGYFSQKRLHESITVKSVEDHRELGLGLRLGLGIGLETNLRGGSGYFSPKSLHERTTVKSVEDHKALGEDHTTLGLGLRLGFGIGLENQSPWWQWVFLSEKPP